MRRRFTRDTQAMRSLSRRRTYIMVSRMPGEGKRDTSSESGQVNAAEIVSNINRGPHAKRKIWSRTSSRKHAPLRRLASDSDRELVYCDHKEKETADTGPTNRRGKQSKDYYY
jgi:hypothetical protein